MTKHDEQLAQELDAFLTAKLQGRPLPPVANDLQADAQLANELLALAQAQEPDSIFLSGLEAQLAAAASKQQKEQIGSERPFSQTSFWQDFINRVKEGFTMKRTMVALGGLAAVILIGAFAWFALNGGPDEPEMVADTTQVEQPITTTTEETTDNAQVEQPSATDETEETAVTPIDTPVPADTAIPDTSNLPKLPILGQGSGGRGIGGGGGAADTAALSLEVPAAEESAISIEGEGIVVDPIFWNPLADAQYTVNAPFPTEPAFTAVYQQPGTGIFASEDVQHYAQLFGLSGPVYTEVFPETVYETVEGYPAPAIDPQAPVWIPPTYYYVFDGQKTLSVYDTSMYYFDLDVANNYDFTILPFDQAAPIAEAFLQERGLLDFPYVMLSPWNGDVEFHRLIEGHVNSTAEFYVSVTDQGNVFSVSYQPFNNLATLGDYPLRSAEEAWQQVMADGIDYRSSYWYTYPGPDYVMPDYASSYEPAPWEELYQYWNRTFVEGDAITLVSYPVVYLPVNNDAAPRIMVDQYLLNGAVDQLQALADYAGQPVKITGVVHGESPSITIELLNWQPEPNQDWQYMPGTIRFDGGLVLFDADEGETFEVPNAPADLADGTRVNLSGWSIERGEGAHRVFNWSSMDTIINWDEYLPEEEPLPTDLGIEEPYKITAVTIDTIDLIYQYSPIFDEQRGGVSTFLLQPAWRYKGTTNTDEIIEIVVQAVPSDFVESSGQ
ncbi:MAG: hypothetical protein H6662_07260 [Ardenticatenaceae bacterium]|nr:hypothetical protein [Anaerolineales bacterium]MCB8921362.1 hypothetical protein [Ardenticatenaceae bacterium]MCB8991484.1 hypothetical protein [Ardenticatenaceae bacterium]MCB9004014.1 hypothetical protein [Ardenticatenaceae bacterium]